MTPPTFTADLLDALRCFELALAEQRGRVAQVRAELAAMWRRNDFAGSIGDRPDCYSTVAPASCAEVANETHENQGKGEMQSRARVSAGSRKGSAPDLSVSSIAGSRETGLPAILTTEKAVEILTT